MEQAAVCPISGESEAEERINFLTHLVGFVAGCVGWLVLVGLTWAHPDPWQQFAFNLYGASLVALYGASTFYHVAPSTDFKRTLRLLDHACIFVLIAGTYTPFALGPLRELGGVQLLAVEWGIAVAGIAFKFCYPDRFKLLSTLGYVAMGWLVAIHLPDMYEVLPMASLVWMLAGGAFYSLGVLFYLWESLPFNHGIWHLFVLGGSLSHFIAVLELLV